MSLAQPITTVAMPAASSSRAASARLWWHTGQLGTSSAASTASARQRATISGASVYSVMRWLRWVGMPWKRGATAPTRPTAAASRSAASGKKLPLSAPVVWSRSIAT